jgi:hypothetical protein
MQRRHPGDSSFPLTGESFDMRMTVMIAAAIVACAVPAMGQTPPPAVRQTEAPASAELAACKSTALLALSERDASIKDIYFDEDGLTMAESNTTVEDTPIKHIIMGEAYLQTDRQDKPRRFLCLIGEKGKVLLTFFTSR